MPVFEDPYDSREIGMAEVTNVNIVRDVWSASDVFSKCVTVPSSHKQRELDPLPATVLESENPFEAFTDRFGQDNFTWKVHSLLLPTRDVLKNMCEKFPIADCSYESLETTDESNDSIIENSSCEDDFMDSTDA